MKYYVVDDVLAIVKVLTRIVKKKELGEVVGWSTDAEQAVKEIIALQPDIVFADLLMPVKDGITMVKEIKKFHPHIHFIMISQVSNKNMISDAYCNGVEFFINKPVNIIEVEAVARRVAEKIQMEATLGGIRQMIVHTSSETPKPTRKDELKEIKYLLSMLGMLGERGTRDLLNICEKLLAGGVQYDKDTIAEYTNLLGEDINAVKQRMRRAVKKGLTNIAAIGLEDHYNEIYSSYAQMVFDYDCLKSEMDHLRGNAKSGGKINLDKFIEGLLIFNEMQE